MSKGGERNVGGKAYIDIDEAIEAVVGLVGERCMAIYKSNRDDWEVMIRKEARADLRRMTQGSELNFMES